MTTKAIGQIWTLLSSLLISSALVSSTSVLALDSPTEETTEQMRNRLEERIGNMQSNAEKTRHTNESSAQAYGRLVQESARRGEDYMETLDRETKARFAATMYLGFYYSNTVQRPEFCEKIGAPLNRWIKEFEVAHEQETAQAKKVYTRAGVEPSSVKGFLPSSASPVTEKQFRDLATLSNTTPSGVCIALEENAEASVAQNHFSRMFRRAYKVLMDIK